MANSQFTTVTDIKPLAQVRGWDYRMAEPPTRQQQDISRTIEEEILDALSRGRQDVDDYIQIHGGSREARVRHNNRLQSVHEYDVPETFTCTIPQATIADPDGLTLTANREILVQSLTQKTPLEAKLMFARVRNRSEQTFSSGRHISLLCRGAQNYFHWIMDGLLRLSLLDAGDTSFKVIIPALAPKFLRETLKLLGIAEDRLVVMGNEKLAVDELLLVYPEEMPAKPKLAHVLEHRRRLFAAAGVDPASIVPHRRLYISRAHSTRPIVNEDELLPILRQYGFEIVTCEQLTVAEQIALFAEATCILGAHGAGLTNLLFAQPGTKVIEIYNRMMWVDCYHRVSGLLGHEHWYLFGDNENTNTWPTRVDERKLDKLLGYALH